MSRADASDDALRALLASARCAGAGSIHLLAREPFWDEEALPFTLHGGGNVLRLVPDLGFRRESLAGSPDERLLVVDCPDDGWLVPAGVVAAWMARHVTCPELDDLLLAHPLYAHATRVDAKGRSRMGRGRMAHWTPGVPTAATLAEPPFTPDDRAAPEVNRRRGAYAGAVVDLLSQLRARFDVLEIEVAARLEPRSVRSTRTTGS
jgi:hypothetical protein